MVEIERQNGINNRQGTDRLNKTFKELLIANYPIKRMRAEGKSESVPVSCEHSRQDKFNGR